MGVARVGPFRKMGIGGGTLLPRTYPKLFPNLELYLDSGLETAYTDGATVVNFHDQSGHSRDALPGSGPWAWSREPVYKTGAAFRTPVGQPVVYWDGAGNSGVNAQLLVGSAAASGLPACNVRGWTLHSYVRLHNKGPIVKENLEQDIFDTNTGTGDATLSANLTHPGQVYGAIDQFGGGNPHVFGNSSTLYDGWHLLTAVFPLPDNNTVPMRFYVDGVLKSQVSGPANYNVVATGNFYVLGNAYSTNRGLYAEQGVMLWYSAPQTAAQIAKLAIWADVFFGIG